MILLAPKTKKFHLVYRLSSACKNSCQTASNTKSLKQNIIQVTMHFDCYPLNSVPNIIMSLDLQLILWQLYKELAAFSPERQIDCLLNSTVERNKILPMLTKSHHLVIPAFLTRDSILYTNYHQLAKK